MVPSRMIHALRSSVVLPVLLLALTPLACSQGKPSDGEQAAPEKPLARALPGGDDGLIVHEWGTFTSMAGSDGASLEGLHHAADALPAFVHTTAPALPSPFHVFGDDSWYRSARHVDGKMETPVVYFYSKKPQSLAGIRPDSSSSHGEATCLPAPRKSLPRGPTPPRLRAWPINGQTFSA